MSENESDFREPMLNELIEKNNQVCAKYTANSKRKMNSKDPFIRELMELVARHINVPESIMGLKISCKANGFAKVTYKTWATAKEDRECQPHQSV